MLVSLTSLHIINLFCMKRNEIRWWGLISEVSQMILYLDDFGIK